MPLDPFAAIQKTLGINREAARIAVGGFIVLSLAISAYQSANDSTVTLWNMILALVGLMLLMMFLAQMPFVVRRIVGSLIAILFSVWATTLVAAVVFPTKVQKDPYCIATFGFTSVCRVSAASVGKTISAEVTISESTPLAPAVAAEISSEVPVFIQFAGFKREAIVNLAKGLSAAGWTIQGADKGGERTVNAAGLSEVRYFNAADKSVAEALAASVSLELPGAPSIKVKDFSGTHFAQPPMSHLEVWLGE